MNRSDRIFIMIVLFLATGLLLSTQRLTERINAEKTIAIARYKDKEVLRLDMDKDGFYTVAGELGDVIIEVSDGRIRVAKEKSPRHYCSQQGWVNKTNVPIVCLPNRVVIEVKANMNDLDEDITIR